MFLIDLGADTSSAAGDDFTFTVPVSYNYTDIALNDNEKFVLEFEYDNQRPEMTNISATAGGPPSPRSVTNKTEIVVSFEASETLEGLATTNFALTAVDGSDNAVDTPNLVLSGAGTNTDPYQLSFTISQVGSRASDTYTLAVSNFNDASGYAGVNNASLFQFVYDSVNPTVTIESNDVNSGGFHNGNATFTFTLSEASTNFDLNSITTSNLDLSEFASPSSTVYTVVGQATGPNPSLSVQPNAFTDAAGNGNDASTTFSFTFDDTADEPVLVLGDFNSSTQKIELTIEQPENGADINASEVTLSSGGSALDASQFEVELAADDGSLTDFTGTITILTDLNTASNNLEHNSEVTVGTSRRQPSGQRRQHLPRREPSVVHLRLQGPHDNLDLGLWSYGGDGQRGGGHQCGLLRKGPRLR